MLNRYQIKRYRELRGVTTREVSACCDLSQPMIVQIENGEKAITEFNHHEITKGINEAYAAKKNGTFKKTQEEKQDKKEDKTESADAPKKRRGRPSKKELEEKKKEKKK